MVSFFFFKCVSLQIKIEAMTETNSTRGAASPTNVLQQDYDITRMREDDFERLAVYIVPDVQCDRGVPNRAEKTLPRSLTLKASLALSTPTQPVNYFI
jgi:PR domain zinc finger protein 1